MNVDEALAYAGELDGDGDTVREGLMNDVIVELAGEVVRLRKQLSELRGYAASGIAPPGGLLFEQPRPTPEGEWETTRDDAGNIVHRKRYRPWSE